MELRKNRDNCVRKDKLPWQEKCPVFVKCVVYPAERDLGSHLGVGADPEERGCEEI